MSYLPHLRIQATAIHAAIVHPDDEPYLDAGKRKLFFLSPRGVRMKALPSEIQELFCEGHFVCADDRGAHFGFIVLRDGVSVRAALDILARHNVRVLPPHHSSEPVASDTIEAIQAVASDFAVLHGFTARQVIEHAHAARGFPIFALQ